MPKTFTDRIRQAIRSGPYSQADVARKLGLTRGAITRFLKGDTFLSERTLDALANLYGFQLILKKGR
jgi:transcriptional regulator with XRE-family HTH domain